VLDHAEPFNWMAPEERPVAGELLRLFAARPAARRQIVCPGEARVPDPIHLSDSESEVAAGVALEDGATTGGIVRRYRMGRG
jgi:hypothetical protein